MEDNNFVFVVFRSDTNEILSIHFEEIFCIAEFEALMLSPLPFDHSLLDWRALNVGLLLKRLRELEH